MRLLKSCVLAFSYYTKIPMPSLHYDRHDGDYMFCFFPLVGLLIGAAEALWLAFAAWRGLGSVMTASVATAVPVMITGGIHLDGLLDASDAIASWKPREERLKIMHDTHTGAFAVISCTVYMLLCLGAATEAVVRFPAAVWFVFSSGRMFTSLLVVLEPPANSSGMLYSCTERATVKAVVLAFSLYAALLTGLAVLLGVTVRWLILLGCGIILTCCFHFYIRRVFGGITGDLAGFFLSVYELTMVIAAALIG